MFEAEFSDKLPELKAREDYLTSCIFGSLKYIPPKDGIFPVINEALNYELNNKLKNCLSLRNISLENIDTIELFFWPRSTEYGEPDIVMLLKGLAGSYIIAIEVKYYSYKHEEGEDDQLKRYYEALNTDKGRATFNCDEIKTFRGSLLAIIYLTQFEARQEITDTLRNIKPEERDEARNRIFHLKWQTVANIIENLLKHEKDLYKRKIYDDIFKLIKLRNLLPFKGFSNLSKEIAFERLFQSPIFFGINLTKETKKFNGISQVPKELKLYYNQFVYYGG